MALSKEVRTKVKGKHYRTFSGRVWRLRKLRTYTHTVYNVGGKWAEPTTTREENEYRRLQLPCVNVSSTHSTLKAEDGADTITLVERFTSGDMANVENYLTAEFLTLPGVVSLTDRTGVIHTFTL